jgi:hypothetical protein
MQQEEPGLPWFAEARLLSPRAGAFDGPLIECLRRWDRLIPMERSRAFIVLDRGGKALTPNDLGRIVSTPEFLSL